MGNSFEQDADKFKEERSKEVESAVKRRAEQLGVGHNNPPDTSLMGLDELEQHLLAEFRNLNIKTGEITVASDDPKRLEISTEAKAERVATFIKQINITKKKADELRKNIRAPYSECASAVQGAYKGIETNLDEAKDKAVKKLLAWLQAKLDKGEDPTVRSDYGQTAFMRETLEVTLVDIKDVPDKYLTINVAAIKKDYKKTGDPIPGLFVATIQQLGVK